MPPEKHLVLDDDVHEQLKSKKRSRGTTLREIGNAVLRSSLNRPALSDAIAKHLIDEGKILPEDYRRARETVLHESQTFHRQVGEVLHVTDHGTLVSGSWEVSPVPIRFSSEYHILEAWALDDEHTPMPLHCHDASVEYVIVISGHLMLTLEEEHRIVGAGDVEIIPRGLPHAVTPMSKETHVVVVCAPPDPSLDAESAD